MSKKKRGISISRVDVQVSIFTAILVVLACLCIFLFHYKLTYNDMITSLENRTESIHEYIETFLTYETFCSINSPEDMNTVLYEVNQSAMYHAKQAAGVQYLYTAKRNDDGTFIYVIDGLSEDAPDFRRPGDPIEEEIIDELERALSGEKVLPDTIKGTEWGKIFITYLPIHDNGKIIGVLGIEFDAEHQFDTYHLLRISTPIIIIITCILAAFLAVYFFRHISNPTFRDLYNTDYLTELKNRNSFEIDLNNLRAQKLMKGKSIIVLNLNHLKKINDSLGHEAGDWYLKSVGRIINESLPSNAAAYRVGGDEFVILASTDNRNKLEQLSVTIKEKVSTSSPPDWRISWTCSIGYAIFDTDKESDIYDTYRRADQNMYEEKQRYHELNRD